jgi:hypothetical protein
MVEVKFELQGGVTEPTAEAAVEKTVRFYQQALEGVTCPTHGSNPSLVVRGNTVEQLAVSIEACCAALSETADARLRAVSRRDEDL